MPNLSELGKQLTESANDQLETLRAVKGEGFAIMVAEFLQMRSFGTIIATALDKTSPIAVVAVAALSDFQARYMTMVQDKTGVEQAMIDEVVEWSERIHDSSKRVVETAMAVDAAPPKDSLH